jgi:aspartate aminotransferase
MLFSKEINESLTLKFSQTAQRMKKEGRPIISLGIGEPDFETPQYILDATIKAIKDGFTKYSHSQGLYELRELISNDANLHNGSDYTPENVIITPGVKSSIFLALSSILEPQDEIIIISPYFVSYPALIKASEPTSRIIEIPCFDDYSINFNAIEKATTSKTKCLFINFPQNPTGSILKKNDIEKIARLCVDNNFFIISDEVYDKFVFKGSEMLSLLKKADLKNRLITTNGYSKSHAMTGWRIGYTIGPTSIISKMNKLQQHINTNTCTFIQKGVCSIYHHHDKHIDTYVKELEKRITLIDQTVLRSKNIRGIKPSAGFFYFADISLTGFDSNSFCAKLLNDTGIAITPGVAFGNKWDMHVRFSVATKMDVLKEAMCRLLEFDNNLTI